MARAKVRNQSKELRYTVFHDNHGREWETTWDTRGMGTTGPTNPKGWTAPVLPPSHCLSEHEDRPKEFTINYSRWLAENRDHQRRYDDELRTWAQRMKLSIKDKDVIEMVGPPPMPVDLIRACQAGNKWALGLVPMSEMPAWAEPYRYVFESKPQMPLKNYPDLEKYADLEDAVDPEAVGGKKFTPKPEPIPVKKEPYFKTAKRDANGKVMTKAQSIADMDVEAETARALAEV